MTTASSGPRRPSLEGGSHVIVLQDPCHDLYGNSSTAQNSTAIKFERLRVSSPLAKPVNSHRVQFPLVPSHFSGTQAVAATSLSPIVASLPGATIRQSDSDNVLASGQKVPDLKSVADIDSLASSYSMPSDIDRVPRLAAQVPARTFQRPMNLEPQAMANSISIEQVPGMVETCGTWNHEERLGIKTENHPLSPFPAGSASGPQLALHANLRRLNIWASRTSAWPDCASSAGPECGKIGKDCCWIAIGAAAELLDTVRPLVNCLLSTEGVNFMEGVGKEDVPTLVRMLMIGSSREHCRPVLAIIDPRSKVRKRIVDSISKKKILKEFQGLRSVALKTHPMETTPAVFTALSCEDKSSAPSIIWGDRGSLAIRPFGFRVAIRQGDIRTGDVLFTTTIGGVLQIDGQFYGLTVAHAFRPSQFQSVRCSIENSGGSNDTKIKVEDGPNDEPDDDEDVYFPDEDEYDYSHDESRTSSSSPETSRSSYTQPSSTQTRDKLPQFCPPLPSNSMLLNNSSFLQNLGEILYRDAHSDWGLIKFNEAAVYAICSQLSDPEPPQTVDSPNLRDLQSDINLMNFEVCVWTGAGKICGVLLPGSFYIKFPGLEDLLLTWTVHLDNSLVRGDSGSWVFDTSTTKLLGLIVAGHLESRTAYLISTHSVLEDITTFAVDCPQLAQNLQLAPKHAPQSRSQEKPLSGASKQVSMQSPHSGAGSPGPASVGPLPLMDDTTVASPCIRMRRHSSSALPENRNKILVLADLEQQAASRSSNKGVAKRVQNPSATFQCHLCTKSFTRAYSLRSHLRTHTDERPFVCTVCGKPFARQHDRKRHEGLHSGEKRFMCKGELKQGGQWGCGRRFTRADALGRHFRSEAGRICIQPLLDEEVIERQQWQDQQLQNMTQNIEQLSQRLFIDSSGFPVDASSSSMLPATLLAQYPALKTLSWGDPPQEDIGKDDEMSSQSSFDTSGSELYSEGWDDGNLSSMTGPAQSTRYQAHPTPPLRTSQSAYFPDTAC